MSQCKYQMSWVGQCKNDVTENGGFCAEHQVKCCSCGAQATHECAETGQFVCGHPLCDECEHVIYPDGTNGGIGFNQAKLPEGMKIHCKKTEQKYKPWYEREKQT